MGTNIFFPHICFARQKEMTAGDFHLKEREIRNCPRQRSLYFPQTFVGTQNALVIITVTALFGDNSMGTQRIIWGDTRQGSNMLRLFSGQRDAETC